MKWVPIHAMATFSSLHFSRLDILHIADNITDLLSACQRKQSKRSYANWPTQTQVVGQRKFKIHAKWELPSTRIFVALSCTFCSPMIYVMTPNSIRALVKVGAPQLPSLLSLWHFLGCCNRAACQLGMQPRGYGAVVSRYVWFGWCTLYHKASEWHKAHLWSTWWRASYALYGKAVCFHCEFEDTA